MRTRRPGLRCRRCAPIPAPQLSFAARLWRFVSVPGELPRGVTLLGAVTGVTMFSVGLFQRQGDTYRRRVETAQELLDKEREHWGTIVANEMINFAEANAKHKNQQEGAPPLTRTVTIPEGVEGVPMKAGDTIVLTEDIIVEAVLGRPDRSNEARTLATALRNYVGYINDLHRAVAFGGRFFQQADEDWIMDSTVPWLRRVYEADRDGPRHKTGSRWTLLRHELAAWLLGNEDPDKPPEPITKWWQPPCSSWRELAFLVGGYDFQPGAEDLPGPRTRSRSHNALASYMDSLAGGKGTGAARALATRWGVRCVSRRDLSAWRKKELELFDAARAVGTREE